MSQTIAIHVDAPFRVWHRRLVERLEALGYVVAVTVGSAMPADRPAMVLALQRRLYGCRSALFEPAAAPISRPIAGDSLFISLGGRAEKSARTLEPLFDGKPGEAALVDVLLDGRAPAITIRAGDGRVRAAGLPAVEDPHVLARALDAVLSRLVTLIVQAVVAPAGREVPCVESLPRRSPRTVALQYLARGLAAKGARRFGPGKGRPDHWRTAFRVTRDTGIATTRVWPSAPFTVLDDDGMRFYADPFPFEHNGRRYVFVEAFPYATGKGVIAVCEIHDAGKPSPPRTVLEAAVHLSYPFLIREGSDIYMMPEMSGARRIQLFRADPFPDRWVADHVLIDDVAASDATIIRSDDRWWLFAAVSNGCDLTWDQLGLYHAPALCGPWAAHPGNPVLIDAGSARPAGAMWHEGGVLMRVAQDCRAGYGAGLAICRVDRLDSSGFAQTVVTRLAPPAAFAKAAGTHTLNRSGDLEVIDLRMPHKRNR